MTASGGTYQQQAYDYVKTQIINLGYKPGQVITDTQVANELDISRTPVREAFYRLENEGLLINEARRGWRVYTLSLSDIHEVFDIKVVVEGMVARQAAACQDSSLRERLAGALAAMRRAADSDDADAWLNADFKLHDVIFEMADNTRAQRIIANLNDQWHRVRIGFVAMQLRIQESTREHEVIVGHILAGEGLAAEREMQEHLAKVGHELERLLVNMVLPFVENGV